MKKLLFCCCIAISCTIELFAQGGVDKIEPIAPEGTYQFIFDTEKAPPIGVTIELKQLIESKRNEGQDVIISIDEHTKIKILARNQMNSGVSFFDSSSYKIQPELFSLSSDK